METQVTREQVIEYLSNIPVIELAALVKTLENQWGVQASPVITTGSMLAPKEIISDEKTEFSVTIQSAPADKKIAVIKVVRELSGLGLKEAKDLVDMAPRVLKDGISKADAEDMRLKLEQAGAVVQIT